MCRLGSLVRPSWFDIRKSVGSNYLLVTGFVEGDGAIAIEAAHATRNTSVGEVAWTEIPNYGRTLSGMTPWPRLGNNETNYTAGAGPSLYVTSPSLSSVWHLTSWRP